MREGVAWVGMALLVVVGCAGADQGGAGHGQAGDRPNTNSAAAGSGGGGAPASIQVYDDGPLLVDCFVGYTFADCGGDGPARLACDPSPTPTPTSPCLWFTGGEVARGFVASDCDANDVCCADSNGGKWPYSRADDAVGDAYYFVGDFLQAWGREPWDRRREARFHVVMDAGLTSVAAPELRIDGEAVQAQTGADSVRVAMVFQDTAAFRFDGGGGLGLLPVVVVELIPGDSGTSARVCRHLTADGQPTTCDPDFHRGPECAVDAEVTVSHVPVHDGDVTPPALRVNAMLADGTAIELAL